MSNPQLRREKKAILEAKVADMSGLFRASVVSAIPASFAYRIVKNAIAGSSFSTLKKYQSGVSIGFGLIAYYFSMQKVCIPICLSRMELAPPSEYRDLEFKFLKGQMCLEEYKKKKLAIEKRLEDYENGITTKVVPDSSSSPQ